jgi:integrase
LKCGTRSWAEAEEKKQHLLYQLTAEPTAVVTEAPAMPRTIQECVDLFLKDKSVQGFTDGNFRAYRHQLNRLITYFAGLGIFGIQLVTREALAGYCATWPALYPSGATRYRVRARHNSFFRFCHSCGWIPRQPEMPRMKEPESETSPLDAEEFQRLLDAVTRLREPEDQQRIRGLFLLQRWSGLAIRDALTLPKAELIKDSKGIYHVVTARQKTKTPVSVPIPARVAEELLRVPNSNPDFFFWDGKRDEYLFSICMGQHVKKVFVAAGLDDGQHMKSHRLRDTFAVELLAKGVPLEEVSKLLGHTSIKTTEKHYAKWVKGRQDRLDSLVMGTWAKTKARRAQVLSCPHTG